MNRTRMGRRSIIYLTALVVPFRMVLVVAALGLCGMSAGAQDKSLGELAREEEARQKSVAQPSKTYTNDDLRPVESGPSADRPSAGCQSEHKYDPASGDTYLIARCADKTTRMTGSNTRTGATWSQTIHADGSQSGTDRCGYQWMYNGQTKTYVNDNGDTREGEAAFRERLESTTPCAARSVSARPASAASNQPFCTDTSRTDASGNQYVTRRCLDGSIRESGTDLRNGTSREWHNTIHPDGSQSGDNGCGVSWSYDAKAERYETSLGENGMGRGVFLANLERLKKCDVYVRP
jgi:hypothetical protein